MKSRLALPATNVPMVLRDTTSLRRLAASLAGILLLGALCHCGPRHQIIVSVQEQRMLLFKKDQFVAAYPVSTSKFTLGDRPGSRGTPLGTLKIAKKIGDGAPSGAVFKGRRRTGEILPANAPGRDPIVTRILWLEGTEHQNRNTYRRFIYIHGTPEEWKIGTPASYGCIRMKSRDVIDLYDRVRTGTPVIVAPEFDASVLAALSPPGSPSPPDPAPQVIMVSAPH